jgi:hypothetical protein
LRKSRVSDTVFWDWSNIVSLNHSPVDICNEYGCSPWGLNWIAVYYLDNFLTVEVTYLTLTSRAT